MVGGDWPVPRAPAVVERTSCPFGGENGSIWSLELPHAATLSRGGEAVANCGSGIGHERRSINSTFGREL